MKTLLTKYYTFFLVCILCFSFFIRIFNVTHPPTYIFDEVYHAVTAKLISRNDPRAYEWWNEPVEINTAVDWLHPPLAKYFQALGILAFGENTLGWRFSSVIFGVLVILAIARLTDLLFHNKNLSLLAGFLASLDGLLLAQSRIAMNDIHVTFFILLTAIAYVKHRNTQSKSILSNTKYLIFTGLSAGLAMASKWSGVYILLPIYLYELGIFISTVKKTSGLQKITFLFQRCVFIFLLPIFIYISSYAHMFWQGKSLICTQDFYIHGQCYYEEFKDFSGEHIIWKGYVSHFVELHRQIWWYQTNLEASHPYQSRPWQWFLNLKPVWFYVDYKETTRADIFALGNPLLFWIGDISIITLLVYSIHHIINNLKKKKDSLTWNNSNFSQLVFLLLMYLCVWLPWQFSPRIMFFYHYTPAVPFLCILTACLIRTQLISKNRTQNMFALVSILLIIISFILFFPQWTGIHLNTELKDTFYFAIKSWK